MFTRCRRESDRVQAMLVGHNAERSISGSILAVIPRSLDGPERLLSCGRFQCFQQYHFTHSRIVSFSVANIFSGVIDFELVEPSDSLVSSCFYGPLHMVVSASSIDKFKSQTDVLPYAWGIKRKRH
jgi:hypothetical protein